jgi:hypothetical protein
MKWGFDQLYIWIGVCLDVTTKEPSQTVVSHASLLVLLKNPPQCNVHVCCFTNFGPTYQKFIELKISFFPKINF